jgi:hypothetical protein
VALTAWHLLFAAIATRVLAQTTALLEGRKTFKMTGKKFMKSILPIGLLYAGSLVCSNIPYLTLSVAFIQMLKVGENFCGEHSAIHHFRPAS